MKQQHHPYDIRTYSKGANRDLEDELHNSDEGAAIDANNMRTLSMDGDNASYKKINGEELLYPNVDNRCTIAGTPQFGQPLASTYGCIGVIEINDHIVEFWADSNGSLPSFIRIDGVIVLQSPDFPITYDHPLQLDKNESCVGGEVYLTDYNVPPMLFNIEDLMTNGGMFGDELCTQKYFDEFNINEHLLILAIALNRPVFIKLTSSSAGINQVLGAGGLPVGYYTYAFRYVTEDGERTAFSAPTPQIPMVVKDSDSCPRYPSSQTHSKAADISSPSTLGIHFKLRVDNTNNYDFIEILRVSWNVEDPKGTPAFREIIGKVDIVDGELNVINFLDLGAEAEEVLSEDQATEVLAAIQRAKAIRYFDSRLYLMNIEYGSRDIDEDVVIDGEVDGTAMFPTIEKIDTDGHTDPWKHTYHKAYMHREKHGWGLMVWDEQGNRSYVRQIQNFTNYELPSRRDSTTTITDDSSYRGTARAANTSGAVTQTHEVFDLANGLSKDDACQFKNIINADNTVCALAAGKRKSKVELPNAPYNCNNLPAECGTTTKRIKAHEVGFQPFTPTSQDSDDCSGTEFWVNTRVKNGGTETGWQEYRPKGFAPDYYALGVGLKGVINLPTWAKAFSVVRTPRAGKVVAQGIAFYALEQAGGKFGVGGGKETDRAWFYSPDIDPLIGIDPTVVDDIIANPSNYEIQCQSPLGFFSEIYSFNNAESGSGLFGQSDSGVDMMVYARVMREIIGNAGTAEVINPNESPNMGIGDGGYRYTAFGKWRADNFADVPFQPFTNGGNGNRTFDILDFQTVNEGNRGSTYYNILLSDDLWSNNGAGGAFKGEDKGMRSWHEPVYIINIVRKQADIPETNITNYEYIGHYQKTESTVGVGDFTDNQEFEIVDERWEDCVTRASNIPAGSNVYLDLERFVFIEDVNGNRRRWVNVTDKTPAQITTILTSLQNTGTATVTDSSGSYTVYGVYTHTEVIDNTAPIFTLVFNYFNTAFNKNFFSPQAEEKVIVQYDSRLPLRVFGGDTTVGEAIFAPLDKQYGSDGDTVSPKTINDFQWNLAFPYLRYELNPRIYVVNRTTGANKVQDQDQFKFDNGLGVNPSFLRQMCVMFSVSSRINMNYAYNIEDPQNALEQAFPMVNYKMRPYEWDAKSFSGGDLATIYETDNNLHEGYKDVYEAEYQWWGHGGFRFLPQTKADNSLGGLTSVPKVGFEEQNLFCTRVIWSEKRPPNIQDTPSVRTFPALNQYDISDDTGEIKFAWDDISGKGNNLYAITDSGICLLLVDKRIVHEINADELATVGSDVGGILNQLWINKDIGMTDEMWRSAAEYSNVLYFCNYRSAYQFSSNAVVDIGRKNYHSKLYLEYLKEFGAHYDDHITGVYDIYHNEYWVSFEKIGSLGDGGSQEGVVNHDLIDILNIVDPQYDPSDEFPDFDAGVTDGDVVNLNNCLGLDPVPVYIGGANNLLLDGNTTFSVCVKCTNGLTAEVQYYNNDTNSYIVLATITEGECYCFSSDSLDSAGRPIWVAENCNPFDGDDDLGQYEHPTLMYGASQEYWQGTNDHQFDRFLAIENRLYGMRGVETYQLDKGKIINGEPIDAELVQACAAVQPKDKQYVRIRVNSDNKPTSIEFFNNLEQCLNNNVQAELDAVANPNILKDYHGFEQYIPRKTDAPHNRMEGRLLVFKIKHNLEEDFKVVSTAIQYKPLK